MINCVEGDAAVTGAGPATLVDGLSAQRPDLVDGVGLIVGIDRLMSEARVLTNFSGNAVVTVLLGKWAGEFDGDQARRALSGEDPCDEATIIDDDEPPALAEHAHSRPSDPRRDRTGRCPCPGRPLQPADGHTWRRLPVGAQSQVLNGNRVVWSRSASGRRPRLHPTRPRRAEGLYRQLAALDSVDHA
jgi:hypothetical protein